MGENLNVNDEIMERLNTSMPLDDEEDVCNYDESNTEDLSSNGEEMTPNHTEDSIEQYYTNDKTIIPLKPKENQHKVVVDNTTTSNPNDISNSNQYGKTGILWGDQIVSKKTNWLIKETIPAIVTGEITIIAGDPGTGKTTVALNLAAHVTRGKDLRISEQTICEEAGIALIWSSEEAADDSLKPRLEAQLAEVSKVGFIDTIKTKTGEKIFFDPTIHMVELYESIKQIEANRGEKVKLLIIDSIADIFTGDSHKNTDARRCLMPLNQLAKRTQIAIIGISHLTKNSKGIGEKQQNRIMGSRAVTGMAGMVYITEKVDNQDTDSSTFLQQKYVIAVEKNRHGLSRDGYYYYLESAKVGNDIDTFRLVWGEKAIGTAAELIDPQKTFSTLNETKDVKKTDQVKKYIIDTLKDKPLPCKEVKKRCEDLFEVHVSTIERAIRALGIKAERNMEGIEVWCLPCSLKDVIS